MKAWLIALGFCFATPLLLLAQPAPPPGSGRPLPPGPRPAPGSPPAAAFQPAAGPQGQVPPPLPSNPAPPLLPGDDAPRPAPARVIPPSADEERSLPPWLEWINRFVLGEKVRPAGGRSSTDPFATTDTMRDRAGDGSVIMGGPLAAPAFIPRLKLKGSSIDTDGIGLAMIELNPNDLIVVRVGDEVTIGDQAQRASILVKIVRIDQGAVVIKLPEQPEYIIR